MKDIMIIVNSGDNQILKNSDSLGISSENLQGKIIFKPEPFVEGTCRMYIEGRGSILMQKEEDCYTLDILSSLLTEPSLDICFKITEPENEKGIPIFCSKKIHFKVLDTIDSSSTIPEDYPSWEQVLDSMIAEVEELEEDVAEAIGNIQDLTEAYNQNATEKTNAFNQNATQKTNDFNANYTQKVNDFDTATDTILATKKGQLDTYEQTKEVELNAYTGTKKAELDSYETAKETEINNYVTTKKTEINTYTGTKKTELDTYEGAKETELNTYASGLKDAFDNNASAKTTAFDENATAKTTAFNDNATAKTGDFNDNVTTKTTEFDAHVTEKEAEFDENVDSIQEQITDIQEFIDSELEQGITEKGTRADVNDSAKWYGELAPEGRKYQKQLEGYNLFNYAQVVNLAYGTRPGESSSYILGSSLYRGYYIPVTPGEHYFVSRKNTTDFNRFRYCYTEIEPAGNVPVISGSQKNRDTYTSFDTVVPEGAGYLFLYLTNEGTDITPEMEVQITKSEELLPYEPFCGGVPSPNPEILQQIQNVEGRSCKNLFDINNLDKTSGGVQKTIEGNILELEAINTTGTQFVGEIISGLDETKTYTFSCKAKKIVCDSTGDSRLRAYLAGSNDGETYTRIAFVDKGSPVVNTEYSLEYSFTGYKYCRIYLYNRAEATVTIGEKTQYSDIQLEEGAVKTNYEYHFEGKRLDFNVCNKNIFDNEWELGIIRGDTGLNQDNSNYIRGKNFIPAKELTNYKISDINNIFDRMLVYEYKSDFSYNLTTNKVVYGYLTTEKDTAYIRIRPNVSTTDTSVKVQIEEGIAASPYEEHKQQLIPFPMQEGQKLMEGDYLADDGVHHVRKQIVLDGTENYGGNTQTATVHSFTLTSYANIIDKTNTTDVYCDKLKNSTGTTANIIRKSTSSGNIIMNFTSDFVQYDAAALKQKIADYYNNNNPFIIQIPLLNEEVDPYTEEQAEAYNELKKLMLNQGVNHIWTGTDGLEPNLQLTYYKSNKQRLNNIEARLELLEG